MDVGAVVVAVSGIVVSGVLGPATTQWIVRTNERQGFHRDRASRDRDELRQVLDEAARLLSAGPRLVRRVATDDHDPEAAAARRREWSDEIFPMRERLALRMPPTHPLLTAYDQVIDAGEQLLAVSSSGPGSSASTGSGVGSSEWRPAVDAFEQARSAFLQSAQDELASVSTTSATERPRGRAETQSRRVGGGRRRVQ